MNAKDRLAMIDLGNSILQKFDGKNTAQIKTVLIKILPEYYKHINIHEHIIISQIRKVYIDDTLSEIALCYFSSIKIDLTGIMYSSEFGNTEYLIPFDNNFNASQLD